MLELSWTATAAIHIDDLLLRGALQVDAGFLLSSKK